MNKTCKNLLCSYSEMRWIDKMATISRICSSGETNRETSRWYCTGTLITNLNNNKNIIMKNNDFLLK